ncbi:MAG: NnrS family protein [Gammaproteobacteria bacterium]|nr:NnrS family protein [Gammaproteobacteria bacterium]
MDPRPLSLAQLGFRPFFLLGSLYSALAMLAWLLILQDIWGMPPSLPGSPAAWHAHEMLYGYALAVIAGFLLTAVQNWTGQPTLNGPPLLGLALLWLLARIAIPLELPSALMVTMWADLAFGCGLCVAVLIPIAKTRQWRQMSVWSKLLSLLLTNLFFYLGYLGYLEDGVRWGLYAGLYLVVSLILLLSRRVVPFFVQKASSGAAQPRNSRWLDLGSLGLFLIFLVVEVFWLQPALASLTAALLAVVHGLRLRLWYSPHIWKSAMLWVLYLAYAWIVFGFALHALTPLLQLNPSLAVHAFAVGGIGLMTLGMMARVALGHTGRDVYAPPTLVLPIFVVALLAAIARVLLPLAAPDAYGTWIILSQLLWISAFALFAWTYAPFLLRPRVDGDRG